MIAVGDLPSGWALARLGDVLTFKYGKALPERERDGTGAPVYGSNGIVGRHSNPLTAGPTLIVGRKGSIGVVHLSDGPCSPIDTTYYVDEFNGQPPKFWLHALQSLDLASLNRATALPGLNRDDAYNLLVLVPPVAEQHRIVARLEELLSSRSATRAALDAVPALLEQYRQSALRAAFDDLYSGEHDVFALESLVSAGRTITYGVVQTGVPTPGGVPTVRCGDIKRFVVAVDTLKRVNPEIEAQYPRTRLRGGEVLLAIRGSVGEVGVAPQMLAGANVSREVAVIPARDGVEAEYLMYLLASPVVAHTISGKVKGVAQSGINIADLRRIEVPLPSPARQREIVQNVRERLASIERLHALMAEARSDLNALEQAVLSKAFRGELTLQNADDEPAPALLERLQSEQSPASGGRRPRRIAVER